MINSTASNPKTILLIFLLVLMLLPNVTFSQQDNLFQYRKDPFLAGAFSFVIPGLGQFYAEDEESGIYFFLSETILFWSTILNVADLKISFVEDIGVSAALKIKDDVSDLRIYSSVGMGLLYLALKIYDIIDAVETVQTYNDNLFRRSFQLTLDCRAEHQGMGMYQGLGLALRF